DLHRDAGLRRRVDWYSQIAGDERGIVRVIEVPMPEEYRLGTQAHQILDHERRSARYSLGAMDVGVEQDDAAFERRGVRCVGDPGKDDLLIVHLAGRGVDVL